MLLNNIPENLLQYPHIHESYMISLPLNSNTSFYFYV